MLNPAQITAAVKLVETRPLDLYQNTAERVRWYNEVCAESERLQVSWTDFAEFCNIAGVPT